MLWNQVHHDHFKIRTAGWIVDIQLESSVEKQFGNQIRRVIEETFKKN